jgi:hypothetical protein
MSERRAAGMGGYLFSPFMGRNGPLKSVNSARSDRRPHLFFRYLNNQNPHPSYRHTRNGARKCQEIIIFACIHLPIKRNGGRALIKRNGSAIHQKEWRVLSIIAMTSKSNRAVCSGQCITSNHARRGFVCLSHLYAV